ncbi:hypothetical protein BDV19DRAFT_359187 [Aspergillus venezuelensis]
MRRAPSAPFCGGYAALYRFSNYAQALPRRFLHTRHVPVRVGVPVALRFVVFLLPGFSFPQHLES